MIEYSLKLVLSIIVAVFIVTVGFYEISEYVKNRDLTMFATQVGIINDKMRYLYNSNLFGSFEQVNIKIPANQSLVFNNASDLIELYGFYNNTINPGVDIINYLNLSSGDYVLTLCFECNTNKSYVVVFS